MKNLTLTTLLILTIDLCIAQSFDVENQRLPGISTLTIKSFNSCCAKKGFGAKYYFNESGHAVQSEHFFKRQKRAVYEYQYDSLGNLTHEIQTYSINDKDRIDTFLTVLKLDENNIILKSAHYYNNELTRINYYRDFNGFDQPESQMVYTQWNNDTTRFVLSYNSKGKLSKSQKLVEDSLMTIHVLRYNEQGDLSYSLIPSIVGKENEPLAIWVGGGRHAPEERYEYTYDNQNRWTEKYIIFNDKKVLLETRKYK